MINVKHVIFNLMLISICLSNANSNSNDKRYAVNDGAGYGKKNSISPLKTQNAFKDKGSNKNCWNEFNINKHFHLMDGIDDRYAEVREEYQKAIERDNFDKEILDMMLKTRGAAESAIHSAAGNPAFIPAGINFGGNCLIVLKDSYLSFHRMKLRNNTHFRINFLHNDLANMVLTAKLSLNDLHIVGAYERMTYKVQTNTKYNLLYEIFYTPAFGEVEFLLRNVQYIMEGRYRILRDKLWIELIASDVAVSDILMMYINKQKENKPFPLQKSFIGRILGLLKTNLDKWFKDYVNDYLTYFAIAGNKASSKFLKYDQEKTIALNEYADYVLDRINKRIEQLNATAVDCRNFTITKANGEEIRLTNGVLLGLDTIHRRSFATCKKDSQLRKVDTVVGFSSLKVYYDYKAVLSTMSVELAGRLVVSVDELIAYMRVTLTKDPENLDVIFDSIQIKKYDQEKTIALNEYADYVLDRINKRIEQLNATAVDCRNFTITKANGEEIRLTNGVLLGLDTIHRRSFATCKKDSQLRKVDTVVGFSSLKVYYDYKAVLSTMSVELAGRLVVSVDELIAYMRVTLTKDPENLDVIFDSIQIKPESLILTDHAAKIMGTFKHLLETHVFNIISNTIIYKIRMLPSMVNCEHTLEGYTSEQALEDGNEEEKMWLKT